MVTPIYTAIFGLILIGLSLNVIKGRRKFGAGLGDADNIEMRRRIRAQANFTEYAPIFLIMLGYVEYGGLPLWGLHSLGIVFILGRFMHAYSVLKHEKYQEQKLISKPVWRFRGMICTFSIIGLMSILLLIQNI